MLMTEREAAETMRLCVKSLRAARAGGKLHYVEIGRAIRYTPADLEAYVASTRPPDITFGVGVAEERYPDVSRAIIRKHDCEAWIYFIACDGFVKIGHTINVAERVRGHQCGCPHDITLLGAYYGNTAHERYLHCFFKSRHHRGEWFRESPLMKRFIVKQSKEIASS